MFGPPQYAMSIRQIQETFFMTPTPESVIKKCPQRAVQKTPPLILPWAPTLRAQQKAHGKDCVPNSHLWMLAELSHSLA